MARIGFVGTGEITSAMVRGLVGQGHQIYLSERNTAVSAALASEFSDVQVADNQTVVDHSDIVWLCVLAAVADDVVGALQFRADQAVISAMVDVDHKRLQRLCAPATDISMTIPMPFISKGGCPLPVYPQSLVLEQIFGERNIILPVTSEQALNAYFAGSAQVAACLAQMREGARWLGEQTGDPAAAESYIAAMFAGTLAELPKDGKDRFDEALQALSTEGGLNTSIRNHMEQSGCLTALRGGLDGLKKRLGLS